jgi:hypothetical protein
MENFSVDIKGLRVQSCDENLLQRKTHDRVEICAYNENGTVYTLAFIAENTNVLKVVHSRVLETQEFISALDFVFEKLGLKREDITFVTDW